MGASERTPPSRPRRSGARTVLAWLLGVGLLAAYLALPDGDSQRPEPSAATRGDDADEDGARPEIVSVSPHDPYPGSTIAIVHSGWSAPLSAYAGKTPLRVLARREQQLVAELPQQLALGDLKVRVAASTADGKQARSKPYHVRVRALNYRKLFRSLVGGAALVVLGIFLLSRGVRESTSLHAARVLSRASRQRGFVLGLGALLGAVTQTTTGAAGLLSGLVSSRVLSIAPAALACLGAPLGAAAAPLLAAGLVEPREGLLVIAIGVVCLLLAQGRRAQALAGLLLGTGLVGFGIQVFRPALEPLLSDAVLWSVAGDLRADGVADLALCTALGAVSVAIMHGPAPLIVLLLGIAQATHHWDLRTLLALLAGSGLGAALAALITAPASPSARALARVHLCLGAASSLTCLLTVDVWNGLSEWLLGPLVLPLHWSERTSVSELGLRLFVGYGLSQLVVALALVPLVPRLDAWLGTGRAARARSAQPLEPLRDALDQVLRAQQAALGNAAALALTGVRRRGEEAEQALAAARREMARLLAAPLPGLSQAREAPEGGEEQDPRALGGVAFALLQLQNALDHLLRQTERMIDARVAGASAPSDEQALPWDDERLLSSLHRLLSEGLEAARMSLFSQQPIDLDSARAREIHINRLEADARGVLLDAQRAPALIERHVHVLQVVDAYEASGNQLYRLAEILCHQSPAVHLASL
jgi:hypothetical protein